MWISRNFGDLMIRRYEDLDRRVKRLELIAFEMNKEEKTETEKKIIASLKDEKAGRENWLSTIEEIVNKTI